VYEIKLYGEVVPFAELQKDEFVNLSFLQNQLQKAGGKDVKIRINSVGGDVDEGFAMYSELRRYAQENNAKITTLAEGRCASIATIIFLAGDTRIVTEYTEPFVHNAWCYTMGDSKKVMRVADDLEKCNDKIAKHYQKHTNLSYQQARELMENETAISPQEAVEFRFATQIEQTIRPKAKQQIINKLKTEMNRKNKTNRRSGFLAKIQAFKTLFGFKNKIVFDAENNELNFYELQDEDTIQIGDKATLNGQPADGQVIIATGETYVFDNGELTEIIEVQNSDQPTDEVEVLEEKVQELEKENQNLEEEVKTLEEEVKVLEEEKEELEELLNKATLKITNMQKNLSISVSKSASSRKNRPTQEISQKSSVAFAVQQINKNKLNRK